MDTVKYTVYLAGEIHSSWRDEIINAADEKDLPVQFAYPELDHDSSDSKGNDILGKEEDPFWYDHKSAKINQIRIQTGLKNADIVIVKFGEKYRQWNAAFDAGHASAWGIPYIVIHPDEFRHALKELDANAQAVCRETSQVIEILEYLCR